MKESMEIALIKYNKKTWCKSTVLGFFIGLAVIVPGISGSTVAIIFKLYDQFLYAISNLFKQFKKCFAFLFPIGIGLVLGILLGFIAVKELLNLLPFAIICLFAGLMMGAFPTVKDELKNAKKTPFRVTLFCVGIAIPVVLGCISAFVGSGAESGADIFASVNVWQVLGAVVVGILMATTQIVPGLSASAILMAIGWFTGLVDSVSMTYWQQNPQIFFIYGGLGVGVLLGLFSFSKLLTSLFSRARQTAYCAIVGLSLGSILSMFCNGDVVEVYFSWTNGTANNAVLDIVLGVIFLIVGTLAAYLLVRYQRKKDQEKLSEQANPTQE